jgi:hypothetical protein
LLKLLDISVRSSFRRCWLAALFLSYHRLNPD